MSKRIVLAVLLAAFCVSDASAQNRFHRRRGALIGGLTGAAVGAAIGDKGDNETAGVLLGGVFGAITGGALGDQKDRRIEQQYHHAQQTRAYQEQIRHQQAHSQWQSQQLANIQASRALAINDVITLVQKGLGEATIIHYIRVNGVQHRLTVTDIITLHDQGVSEPIINAMQSAPVRHSPPVNQPQYQHRYRGAAPVNSFRGADPVQAVPPHPLHVPATPNESHHRTYSVPLNPPAQFQGNGHEVIVDPNQLYGPSIIVP